MAVTSFPAAQARPRRRAQVRKTTPLSTIK